MLQALIRQSRRACLQTGRPRQLAQSVPRKRPMDLNRRISRRFLQLF